MDQSDFNTHLSGSKAASLIQPLKSIYVKDIVLDIYRGNDEGQQTGEDPVFRCIKDNSQVCCADFNYKVSQFGSEDQTIMQLYQEFQFCKLCNTNISVLLVNKGDKQKIGSVYSPYTPCSPTQNIENQHGELKYQIVCKCCQVGFICPCPCQSCLIVRFQVYDSNKQQVAEMKRVCLTCYQKCCNKADGYFLKFPINSTAHDKLLLMAAVILIDKTYYDCSDIYAEALQNVK